MRRAADASAIAPTTASRREATSAPCERAARIGPAGRVFARHSAGIARRAGLRVGRSRCRRVDRARPHERSSAPRRRGFSWQRCFASSNVCERARPVLGGLYIDTAVLPRRARAFGWTGRGICLAKTGCRLMERRHRYEMDSTGHVRGARSQRNRDGVIVGSYAARQRSHEHRDFRGSRQGRRRQGEP